MQERGPLTLGSNGGGAAWQVLSTGEKWASLTKKGGKLGGGVAFALGMFGVVEAGKFLRTGTNLEIYRSM